jgi:hypothetical protein
MPLPMAEVEDKLLDCLGSGAQPVSRTLAQALVAAAHSLDSLADVRQLWQPLGGSVR